MMNHYPNKTHCGTVMMLDSSRVVMISIKMKTWITRMTQVTCIQLETIIITSPAQHCPALLREEETTIMRESDSNPLQHFLSIKTTDSKIPT